jgi:amidase
MDLDQYLTSDATTLAGLVAAKEVTASELLALARERSDAVNPTINAVVMPLTRVADSRAAGPGLTGPFAGVPFLIKDLAQEYAGFPTSSGSRALAHDVATEHALVTRRFLEAGLVIFGKTNTPEFGAKGITESVLWGPARSPWDVSRTPGGSSGGSGAAVAAGIVPAAGANDGGGSIRIPASCCGLVGLKPTRGRISAAPMYGEVTGLATPGPLARTVRDAAALLDVMAGRAVGDPFWAPEDAAPFLAACDREPGRLRIGRFATPVIADAEVDPECLQAWEDASRLLESLGHEVIDIEPPMPRDAVPVFETSWAVLTALSTVNLAPEAKAQLRPLTRWLGEWGERISGPHFGLALGELRRVAARALAAVAPYDVVLTQTLAVPPLPVGVLRDDDDPTADFEAQKRFTPWTSMWNVTGSPAVSLPLHQTPHGLPVGVMLAARPGDEALLLSLSAQVEAAAPWIDRHPPCW